jgi:hypothetical protein
MRTTLAIDDDVLSAARELAAIERRWVGEVISPLARAGLTPAQTARKVRNGIALLPRCRQSDIGDSLPTR